MEAQTRLDEAVPESQRRLSQPATTLATHGYIVQEVIGQGTYAIVKKAFWSKHNRTVAIKIMSKINAGEVFLQKCVPRELDVIRSLRHENIIHFYEVIETTMRIYISMRYAENGSLLQLIRKETRLAEPRARRYYRQLISALEYIHAAGFAHRDIKLENMVLDVNDRLKLIDFGFACRLGTDENGNARSPREKPYMSGTFCGSHAYASPEILRFKPYDPIPADIWASGVVLYSLLFGKLPFSNHKQVNVLLEVRWRSSSNYLSANVVYFPPFPFTRNNQKISQGVRFPAGVTVTEEVKNFLKQIFVPVQKRLTWPLLGRSLWFYIELENDAKEEPKEEDPAPDGRVDEPPAAKRSKTDNKTK
uniref:Protein kinase domain-containing protein n=1 Tax=Anopheles epiroticus TaxID=199890 RepID=A0A182P8Q1_9DIPT